MKKIIIILTSVLLFVFVVLSICGLKGDYNAERERWGINRQLSAMLPNQESTPDYAIEQLANKYRAYSKKYQKTVFAQSAQIMLGDLYAIKKNYTHARTEYHKAVSANLD